MVLGNGGLNRIGLNTIPFIIGFVIICIIFLAASSIALALGSLLLNQEVEAIARQGDIADPRNTIILLSGFLGVWAAIYIVVRFILNRPLWVFSSTEDSPNLSQFITSALIFGGALLCFLGISLGTGGAVAATKSSDWWLWLVPLLIIIFIQVTAEEYVFRGYLQCTLYDWFGLRFFWMILPSILFAVLHYAPGTYGPNAWLAVLAIFVFGLLCAELTYKTGSIAWASGLHFVNNVMILVIAGPKEGLGAPYFYSTISPADPSAFRNAVLLQIALYVIALALVFYKMPRHDSLYGIELSESST